MHAGNVTTPTLFVHGEADLRVPIEQGEQMYTALKKRKVPARFIRYPDSYHGGWTPWNTVHRYQQELGWWRTHLQAPVSTERARPADRRSLRAWHRRHGFRADAPRCRRSFCVPGEIDSPLHGLTAPLARTSCQRCQARRLV